MAGQSGAITSMTKGELPKIFGGQVDEVPESYIYKNGYPQPINDSVPYMDPLLIDFSLLVNSSDPNARDQELDKFKSALTSWGCFQFVNHGISSNFLEEMREVFRQFVALPMEEKQKYAMQRENDLYNGYSFALNTESKDQVLDWNEGISLTLYPEDRRKLEFWPEKPLQFKNMLNEYTIKITNIFDVLFKKVLHAMGLGEEKISSQIGKNKEVNSRFNFYPRCPSPDCVLGLKPHADFSPFTIILQDVAGLQVLKDGQWFTVPVVPDALFVSIGDTIEIMSNGIFKSVVHRVVTNAEKSRASIALFWDSDRNSEIGPLDELITADQPQLYNKVSLQDYYTIFYETYQSGKRPIDYVKIQNPQVSMAFNV